LLAAESDDSQTPSHDSEDHIWRQKQMAALVEAKLTAMSDRQWRFNFGNNTIQVRDQVDRIVKLVMVAKDFASTAAALDPVHAGLPWAGVCMLLPVSGFHYLFSIRK
jgi:hypothetical protein